MCLTCLQSGWVPKAAPKTCPSRGIFLISFLTLLRHVVRWNAHRAEDQNNIPLRQPSKGSWNSIKITDSISSELDAATLHFGCLTGEVCVVTFKSDVETVLNWVSTWKGKLLHTHESVRAVISCHKVDAVFWLWSNEWAWAWNASFQACVILFTAR